MNKKLKYKIKTVMLCVSGTLVFAGTFVMGFFAMY